MPSNEKQPLENIVHIDEVEKTEHLSGKHMGGYYKPLTPAMRPRDGRLGLNVTYVPPGRTACPFHTHQLEDEIFYILSGRGVFRYGEHIENIKPGDCISCPAGTGIAHQIANPYDEELVYLAIGLHEPNEVCTYPDSGKVFVRSLNTVGHIEQTDYYENEPEAPIIFKMANEP